MVACSNSKNGTQRSRHIFSQYTSLLAQLAFAPFPLAPSTSRTAQGGGGSFKDRKPTGEVWLLWRLAGRANPLTERQVVEGLNLFVSLPLLSLSLSFSLSLSVSLSLSPVRLFATLIIFLYLSACLFVHPFLWWSFSFSIYDCLSLSLSIYLSTYLSISLSLFLYLSLSLSLYLSISVSLYLPISLSRYLSISLSLLSIYLCVCLSVCLCTHLPIYPSTYLSTYLPIYLSIDRWIDWSNRSNRSNRSSPSNPSNLSIYLSIYLPTHPSTHPSIHLAVLVSIHLFICPSCCYFIYRSSYPFFIYPFNIMQPSIDLSIFFCIYRTVLLSMRLSMCLPLSLFWNTSDEDVSCIAPATRNASFQLSHACKPSFLTRRRMARERRGAGSSLVSMETQFLETIYERCVIGSREEEYQDKIVRSARQ